MSLTMEEDISCPVCQDVYRDPVVLFCSHSFCRLCLKNWWEEKKKLECPLCKEESITSDPPCNLALKKLCDRFLLTRKKKVTKPEVCCRLHAERKTSESSPLEIHAAQRRRESRPASTVSWLTTGSLLAKSRHKVSLRGHQDIRGCSSMIDFVIVSSDLRPYVLDTQVNRGSVH
ncbi:hypothetical protein CCH79_00019211 [Gambusia affinis]|uniref:RING-type domain-containing protein n=1 Tax=Gambusia affinis TaxID=33528 RepID=A0A315V4N2_GAMAF|nr:hypothetical protein CCH79_00019211 [Gambusia affinis]